MSARNDNLRHAIANWPQHTAELCGDLTNLLNENERMTKLLGRLLDPEDLGHAVTAEVRNAAKSALGIHP